MVNRAGIEIFADKVWNIPNEGNDGYIEEQVTNEVLGFEDITSGELNSFYLLCWSKFWTAS